MSFPTFLNLNQEKQRNASISDPLFSHKANLSFGQKCRKMWYSAFLAYYACTVHCLATTAETATTGTQTNAS